MLETSSSHLQDRGIDTAGGSTGDSLGIKGSPPLCSSSSPDRDICHNSSGSEHKLPFVSVSLENVSKPQLADNPQVNASSSLLPASKSTASWEINDDSGNKEENCDELDDDAVRSRLVKVSMPVCSCRSRFLGLPGAPLSLNLQGNDSDLHLEQPVLSPEHLSLRAPVPC
ncbi:uncharacterized protein N7483_004081 [Penicillium malachiteum]|uniref:uncharacterized protein n=1 Tax=Penicillium malachiteum TaxID=1324776 RepID=UPI002548C522|nr:uncharacterized protein N7483_004081 [Penicillium malachiteum]KAJ5729573.1 hypothetical protein N7483_004081 [Penicillium malachiteum]